MVGGATALFGGLYYWYPKITGKMYDEFLGKIHFGVYMIGFNLLYFPMFLAWETPRRVFDYGDFATTIALGELGTYVIPYEVWHNASTLGRPSLGASFLIMFYNLFVSYWRGEDVGDNPGPTPPPRSGPSPRRRHWRTSTAPPSYASGKLEFLDDEEVARRSSGSSGGGHAGHGAAATDGGTSTDGGAIAQAGPRGRARDGHRHRRRTRPRRAPRPRKPLALYHQRRRLRALPGALGHPYGERSTRR